MKSTQISTLFMMISVLQDAVICVPVPLYHCFGMVMACLQSITHGATCVWPSQAFDVPTVLKSIEEFR